MLEHIHRPKSWGRVKQGTPRMDASTRPPHIRHQGLERVAPALVAALFLHGSVAFGATEKPITAHDTTPEITLPASGEMAITTVPAGNEGLELSARYTEGGTVLIDNVTWKITDQDDATVYDKTGAVAKLVVAPGSYHVEASFGSAHLVEGVNLQPGTKLGLSFVLNAGALRILPRVKGVDEPSLSSITKVFALSGIEKGKLVATSSAPGEVLNVAAGEYRIESRFTSGNAVAVTDVNVKAGFMSAVNIDHIAGLAKLTYAGSANQDMQWLVTDEKGTALPTINGMNANLVLKPGHYVANAIIGKESLRADFDIAAGQTQEISLGQ